MLTVTQMTLSSHKLPAAQDGCRIVHLTDLHGKMFGAGNRGLLEIIEQADPAFVVSTGDMVNSIYDSGRVFLSLVAEITKKRPLYCVAGNHEQKIARQDSRLYARIRKGIAGAGAVCVDNDVVRLAEGFNLYGLDIPMRYYCSAHKMRVKGIGGLKREDIRRRIGCPDRRQFNILLAHTPQFFDAYAAWGADLTFCGHIHGGMIRLPFLGGLLSPDVTFFPKYDAGLFTQGLSNMIVGRGLGSNRRIRLFNPPEVIVATLRRTREEPKPEK